MAAVYQSERGRETRLPGRRCRFGDHAPLSSPASCRWSRSKKRNASN